MSIFNLLHLEPMLHTLASVWTLAGELLTAGALLWCLNALARFIRLVYETGRWTGWFWRTYLVPALLYLADSISWGVAQVDWLEVRRVLKLLFTHTVTITVLTVRALRQVGIYGTGVTLRALTVSFGVLTNSYNWVEAHLIDSPLTDSDSVEVELGLIDSPHSDSPVRTVIRRTEGVRGIERSIDRNERSKRPVMRRRHGRLIAVS